MTFKAHILIEIKNFLGFNTFSSKRNYSFTKFCYLSIFNLVQVLILTFEVKG